MDNIEIRFGTPEPIEYREIDAEYGIDTDVLCRVCGTVIVKDCPEEDTDINELKNLVKDISLQSLNECLENVHNTCSGSMFYSSEDRDAVLEKAIEEALVQKGIQSEVKIAFFSMSPDSEAEINAFKKAYDEHLLNTIMHMDNALNIQNEEAFGRHSYWNCMYTSKPEAVKFYEQQSANVNSQDGENR